MISRSKQNWEVGEIVNVGFLKGLMVTKKEPTPGDFRPDVYHLVAKSGAQYVFTPHYGIERVN